MNNKTIQIPEPKISRLVFSDTRVAWLWLAVRLYVGYDWLTAGWGKFNNAAWIGEKAGTAIQGFFAGALAKTENAIKLHLSRAREKMRRLL